MQGDRQRALIIAETAAFIGLIAIGSWISVPFLPVPLTLQTMFVLLAAIVMKRYAVIPATLFILFGALNLPVFHNGTSGIGVLLGPTGGYLIGFIPAALVAGLAYEKRSLAWNIAGICVSEACIYTIGAGWLAFSTGMSLLQATIIGVLPFLPGDAVKAWAAHAIGKRIPPRDMIQAGEEGAGGEKGP
ncbi:MAG: biotin transporter BioY [Methanomicrobiales archaeon]